MWSRGDHSVAAKEGPMSRVKTKDATETYYKERVSGDLLSFIR